MRGPSGGGKSSLALRALAYGWRLVADDRVRVWRSAGALYGAAPPALAGLIEVRGLDVVRVAALPFARIRLIADALAADEPGDRIPERERDVLEQVAIRRIRLPLKDACAPLTLQMALDAAAREAI